MRFYHKCKSWAAALALVLLMCILPACAQAESSAAAIKTQMEGIRQLLEDSGITYFTKTGAACGHSSGGSCDNCMLKNMLPNAPAGLYTGAQAYAYAPASSWTCVGYARWMFYNLFGHMPYDNSCAWMNIADAKPGDYVATPGHAGIFYAWANTSKTQFYMYDGNHADFRIHFADLAFSTGEVKEVLRSTKDVRQIVSTLSAGVQNIQARAYQQVNMEWTPVKDVKAWGDFIFRAGTAYKGIPYGQPYDAGRYLPFNASFDTFLSSVVNPDSAFYLYRGAGGGDSPYYANDCSAFVSYCYNLSRNTTVDLAVHSALTTISGLANAQIGDCLVKSGVHVILITNIYTYNGVKYYTICHQTPPRAIEETFPESAFKEKYVNNGYIIRRLNNRDNVPAPVTVNVPQNGGLDVKGCLDGAIRDNLGDFGTFDITVGTGVRNDVNDYVHSSILSGTQYAITDIRAADGYDYLGVKSGSTSGTVIANKTTEIVLNFATQGRLLVQGALDGVDSSSTESYGSFDVYINGELDASGCTSYNRQWPNGTSYEIRNIQTLAHKNYHAAESTGLTGTITSAVQSKAVLVYTSDGTATTEWQTGRLLPGNLDPNMLDVEYRHHYEKNAVSSPGEGWVQSGVNRTYYHNSGGVQEFPYEKPTSDTYVYVNSFYYHWCGSNYNCNYERVAGKYETYHGPNWPEAFNVTEVGTDSNNASVQYYKLVWKAGQPYTGEAICGTGQTAYWYRAYQYQPRVLITEYRWTKDTDWSDTLDASSSSHLVRWRLKGGIALDPESITEIIAPDCLTLRVGETAALEVSALPVGVDLSVLRYEIANPMLFSMDGENNLVCNYAGQSSASTTLTISAPNGVSKTVLLTAQAASGSQWEETEIPNGLDPALLTIEYKHQYQTVAASSPGEGWVQSGVNRTYYQNTGAVEEFPYEKPTSDTYVYVNSFFYHWCGSNYNCNYERVAGKYETYHGPNWPEAFNVTEVGTDSNNASVQYYKLVWKAGQPYTGAATCATGQTAYWYRAYQYQPRKLVTEYLWTRETDWTDTPDPAADSTQTRWRLNIPDGQPCMYLPAQTTEIEDEAFAQTAARFFFLPGGVTSIGDHAFPQDACVFLNTEGLSDCRFEESGVWFIECGSYNEAFAALHPSYLLSDQPR